MQLVSCLAGTIRISHNIILISTITYFFVFRQPSNQDKIVIRNQFNLNPYVKVNIAGTAGKSNLIGDILIKNKIWNTS